MNKDELGYKALKSFERGLDRKRAEIDETIRERGEEQVDWLQEYSKLLVLTAKYMSCVGANEGVLFLYEYEWSKDDWEMLQILSTMSENFDFFELAKKMK